ncbi:hypothetical protein LAZ67_3002318 [Cordylochernes scorpioides]|uniref:Uncharacterized protein n=1 Tax=Cordylochernes scorpioides TaxID=51811 RepID=A0ABY6KB27_9ARAC|nr:hypothetical protein LAZ67_3002318 [Cordylochernes scorpioides]
MKLKGQNWVKIIQWESFIGPEDKRLKDFMLRLFRNIKARGKIWKVFECLCCCLLNMTWLIYSLNGSMKLGGMWDFILMNLLRENYWILRFRKTLRTVIHQCVKCRRFTAKSVSVKSVVGIDLTGSLVLKNRRKVWIVIFTCAVYRAVHLELVTSLSTDTFLQAFRRFVARRGRPYVVYSGTNFRGSSRALRNLHITVVQSESTKKNINWKFIPPSLWGDKRFLVNLDWNLRNTILCDTESLMNSRPLTENVEDLNPLTSVLFLHDLKKKVSLQERYRFRQRIREDLLRRFRAEYFGFLRQETRRRSKTRPIMRVNWPLARVMEVYHGRDGTVRVAKLRKEALESLRFSTWKYANKINIEKNGTPPLPVPSLDDKGGGGAIRKKKKKNGKTANLASEAKEILKCMLMELASGAKGLVAGVPWGKIERSAKRRHDWKVRYGNLEGCELEAWKHRYLSTLVILKIYMTTPVDSRKSSNSLRSLLGTSITPHVVADVDATEFWDGVGWEHEGIDTCHL